MTQVDALIRRDHSFLEESDNCYFLGEFRSKEYKNPGTDLIGNFKKGPEATGYPAKYRNDAIRQIGETLARTKYQGRLFVPVPPSEAPDDPLIDHRLRLALEAAREFKPDFAFAELVYQAHATRKSHVDDGLGRVSVEELLDVYRLNESLIDAPPQSIVILDDVLTTGRHYRAMRTYLGRHFPSAAYIGLFVCRRIPKDPPKIDWAKLLEEM